MKILVTGGSGMLGKHLKNLVKNDRENNWIFLSRKDVDLEKYDNVLSKFMSVYPDVVLHLAAKCGGIKDNAEKKYDYMTANVIINTNVIEACRVLHVKNLKAISSSCAYPCQVDNWKYPLLQEFMHDGPPEPTNIGYAYSKRLMQLQIDLCNEQYGTNYSYLIASNMFGEYDKFDESSHFISRLIRKIWEAKTQKIGYIELYGTGKSLRQFMYAEDFAKIILDLILAEDTNSINVAPPWNYSIDEMIRMAIKILDLKLDIRYLDVGLDGQFRKDVASDVDGSQFTPFNEAFEKVYRIMEKKWEST